MILIITLMAVQFQDWLSLQNIVQNHSHSNFTVLITWSIDSKTWKTQKPRRVNISFFRLLFFTQRYQLGIYVRIERHLGDVGTPLSQRLMLCQWSFAVFHQERCIQLGFLPLFLWITKRRHHPQLLMGCDPVTIAHKLNKPLNVLISSGKSIRN